MAITQRSELGFAAEEIASDFLKSRGYEIRGRNFRKPWGEIDVIAEKEGILIFVEVKANKSEMFGFDPDIRADWKKMAKVVRTARTYLIDMKIPDDKPWQIDVITVVFNKEKGTAKIKHFKNIDI